MKNYEEWRAHAHEQQQRRTSAFIWGMLAGGAITVSVFRVVDLLVFR